MLENITYLLAPLLLSTALVVFSVGSFANVYKNALLLLIAGLLFELYMLFLAYDGKLNMAADLLVIQFFLVIEFALLLVWMVMRLQFIKLNEFNLYRLAMLLGILTQWYVSLYLIL